MSLQARFRNSLLNLRIQLIQFIFTHFKSIWHVILNTPIIKIWAARFLYNMLGNGADFPFLYSTKYSYPTVDAIEDYRYYSRMLPEKPRAADYQYPPVDELVEDLFIRKGKSNLAQRTDRNSSLLFGGWAQWFAAGFLLTDDQNPSCSGLYPTSTANLDATYGNDEVTRNLLRSHVGGKLKSQMINGEEYPLYIKDIPEIKQSPLFQRFLQRMGTVSLINKTNKHTIDSDSLFAFGQIQINATPGTVAWGVIFLREHNQICEELQKRYPAWNDERLYHTARNISTLILTKVVLRDYIGKHNGAHLAMELPLTPEVLRAGKWSFGIARSLPIEWNYLYRFHSFVPDTMQFDGEEISIATGVYDPAFVVKHGLNKIIDQLSRSPICPFGPQNTPFFLSQVEKQTIEEGRRLNLASYNDYRERMGFPRAEKFTDINPNPVIANALHKHYKTVDEVEWYVGMIAESVPAGRLFPPLLNRMLSSVAFSVILLQPWLAPSIWRHREELLTPFGGERLDATTIESLLHRHVAKDTHASFFLPKN